MRTRTLVLCSLLGLTSVGPPSVLAAPPREGEVPPLDPLDDRVQRKAIRGGAVDLSRESPELRELREFERATFPRAGMKPATPDEVPSWPREGDPDARGDGKERTGAGLGPDDVPDPLRSPQQRRPESSAPPVTIPWLSSLKLLDNLGLSATFVRFEAHVIKYLEFYKEDKRGRAIMASWLKRQGRYRALIEEVLDRHQLPRFLLYVSMIESGYDPHDRSIAGAVGLWQFLPENARIYGLRVDYWVDERKDPIRSTEAAARYLGDLKARFGSWHLALAAFNAGYGAVLRAMQKYNTNDYWELCRHEDGLPWETLLYVPKAIATALVGENRSLFSYDSLAAEPPLSFDKVPVPGTVSLAAAARAAGSTTEELERLNPELRRGRTPPMPPGGSWVLRLPKGSGNQFLANYDPRRERLDSYVVRFGERLDDIARGRGISAAELRRLNGVEDSIEVRAGVTLVVPPLPPGDAQKALPPPPSEPVVLVAVPDKRLVVPGHKRVFYRVIPGDTISAIARFFKVTQNELLRWNNLDLDATLATKMVLDIWVDKDFDTSQVALVDPGRVRVVTTGSDEFFDLVETLRGRKRVVYICKTGDTMQKVAKRYGLTAADLERINRLGKTTDLRAGQQLTVYVNMSEKEKQAAMHKLVPGGLPGAKDKAEGPVVTPIEDGEDEEGAAESEPAKEVPKAKVKEDGEGSGRESRTEEVKLPKPPEVPTAPAKEPPSSWARSLPRPPPIPPGER